jgi:hypothetical protein
VGRRERRPRRRGREVRAAPSDGDLTRLQSRTTLLAHAGIASLLALATALTAQCGGSTPSPSAGTSAGGSQPPDQQRPSGQRLSRQHCAAMWREGFELAGVAGGREAQAYFDTAPVQGAPPERISDRISGIVLFPQNRGRLPLADAAIGLAAPPGADVCAVQFTQRDGDDAIVWTLRIDSRAQVSGHRLLRDGPTEDITFSIVPETPCDGAGAWRTFSSPDWPIAFDYPAAWAITPDHDDIAVECPSVTRLAVGGSWLSFEQGQFGVADPFWFSRSAADDWRVNAGACVACPRARRSERNGITMLQGAAGEHRLHRPGVGYLGPGGGITRYLFIAGDRWVSLDMADSNGHHDDLGADGGAVLLDGDTVGDRLVRSIRPR